MSTRIDRQSSEMRACYVSFPSHVYKGGFVWMGREEGCNFKRGFHNLDEIVAFYKKSFVSVSIAYLD